MAKQIKKSDLVESNPFIEVKKSADEARASVVLLEKALSAVKEASKMVKTSAPQNVGSTKDINALNEAFRKGNELAKSKMQIDKDLQKERLKLQQLNREYNTLLKEEIALEQKEIGTLERLKVENQQLRREREKLNLSTKEGERRMREINAQLDKNNAVIKKSGDAMKQQRMNVGNYSSALEGLRGKLLNVAGAFGLAFGATSVIRNAGQTIATFNQSIADLQAITGASGKDLQFYKDQAIELGKNTEGGAAAVVEAYKLIGSAKPELLENAEALNDVTKAAITLSKASGLELPDAASRLTDAMNQFGADASQATRFIDALANGAKFGSAEIPQVTDAMLKFGAVAKTSNVSLEESTALIEALGERGLKGAEAGTALRNVMLKLSAPDALPKEAQERLSALGINFEALNDKSKPFTERLSALKPLLKDNAALVKTFGSENAVAATNLISSIDRIDDLTEKMGKVGTASEQANIRSKTLGEAWKNIGRAWDSFVLSVAKGEGSMGVLIDALDGIAKYLPTIIKNLAIFGATMAAMKIRDKVKDFIDYRKALKEGGDAMTGASSSAKAFGQALKGIGFSVAISLLLELVKGLYDFASGAARARREAEAFNQAISKGAERAQADLRKANELIDEQVNLLREKLSKGQITQQEFEERSQQLTKKGSRLIQERIDMLYKLRKAKELEIEENRRTVKNLEQQLNLTYESQVALQTARNELAKSRGAYKFLNAEIEVLKDGKKELVNRTFESQLAINEMTKATDENTKASKENKKALEDQKEAVFDIDAALQELQDNQKKRADELKQLAEDVPDFGLPLYTDAPTAENVDFETDEERAQRLQHRLEMERMYIDLATQYFTDAIDERIAKIDEEMKAAQNRADLYRELAKNGTITAKESLAEQDRLIAESNARKEREEKRKQRILLVSGILSSYNANLQAGDDSTTAFTKALTSQAVLQQFIAALPAFEKGTEDTGLNGSGVDGRGGMLSVLHPGERVMTREQNRLMKGYSNDEVAQIIHNHKFGKLIDGYQLGGAWESTAIVNQLMNVESKIAGVEKAILNKPEHSIELGRITQSAMTLIEKTKTPRLTTTKRHIIK